MWGVMGGERERAVKLGECHGGKCERGRNARTRSISA